jgi:hypothetical protein
LYDNLSKFYPFGKKLDGIYTDELHHVLTLLASHKNVPSLLCICVLIGHLLPQFWQFAYVTFTPRRLVVNTMKKTIQPRTGMRIKKIYNNAINGFHGFASVTVAMKGLRVPHLGQVKFCPIELLLIVLHSFLNRDFSRTIIFCICHLIFCQLMIAMGVLTLMIPMLSAL